MARYKAIDTSPRFLAVDLEKLLLPGSFEHAVHHLLDHEFDLSHVDTRYRNDQSGSTAYPPGMLLKVILCAYAQGVVSSRGIERLAKCSPEAAIGWSKRWRRWADFPNADFVPTAAIHGLYLEVWSNDSDRSVVVALRGTEFTSFVDWLANFRWVRISRFFPGFNDQYSDISTKFAELFVDELAKQYPDLDVKIYATGHSLGGGLAQHFAYSVAPLTSDGKPVPRVSQVFAFNPSPVTGWSSVRDKVVRDANAEKLHIHR